MSDLSTPSSKRVLEAALRVFARYGFRRTSMADVAAEAGVSRPALYQWFANKEALFRAVGEYLAEEALKAAAAAWPPGKAPLDGIQNAILAKDLPLLRLLSSPHGAELMSVDACLTAAMARSLEDGFAAILSERIAPLAEAGAVSLSAFGSPAEFGMLVSKLAGGLKHEAKDEASYIECVERLCRVVNAALHGRS
jgi:AcrR family transcriptional regulator